MGLGEKNRVHQRAFLSLSLSSKMFERAEAEIYDKNFTEDVCICVLAIGTSVSRIETAENVGKEGEARRLGARSD